MVSPFTPRNPPRATPALPLPASWFSPASTQRPATVDIGLAQQLKAQGNWYSQQGQYEQATYAYTQAIEANPAYTDAWFNLATLHREQKQWGQAIPAYLTVMQLNPDDMEAALRLGECYDYHQQASQALPWFDYILRRQPGHDVARRKKAWLLFRLTRKPLDAIQPQLSQQLFAQKQRHAFAQAHAVLNALAQTEGVHISDRLGTVTCKAIDFEPGSPSLAEYDASTDSIHIIPELVFANPSVLAAYLAHEYIHANDRDSVSDVDEELRGYQASIKVWLIKKGMLTEPNLDFATDLYLQGEHGLRQRIESVYLHKHQLLSATLPNILR